MEDDRFSVRVSDLLGRRGSTRRVVLTGDLPIELDQMEECGPVRADLRIEEVVGGVLVRGRVSAAMRLRCNRCATPLAHPARAPVLQAYGLEAAEDAFEIDDGVIDLAAPLRDELCLSVPLAPLCSETCRGLCPSCGSDLNKEPCGGHAEPSGSPFAALADMLESAPPQRFEIKPSMTLGVVDGSTEEKDVAFPHPAAQGRGYEDAPGSASRLPEVWSPEAPAPSLHG